MLSSLRVAINILAASTPRSNAPNNSVPGFNPPSNLLPGQGNTNVDSNLTQLLNTVYLWAGIICVIIIITAGISYAISAGDPGKITKAKNTIIGALVGLVIIIMAFTITGFVTGVF